MTREEAMQELQNCKGLIQQDGQDYLDERDIPLLDIAIEALTVAVSREGTVTLNSPISIQADMFIICVYRYVTTRNSHHVIDIGWI